LWFLARKFCTKNACVKCWWNWLKDEEEDIDDEDESCKCCQCAASVDSEESPSCCSNQVLITVLHLTVILFQKAIPFYFFVFVKQSSFSEELALKWNWIQDDVIAKAIHHPIGNGKMSAATQIPSKDWKFNLSAFKSLSFYVNLDKWICDNIEKKEEHFYFSPWHWQPYLWCLTQWMPNLLVHLPVSMLLKITVPKSGFFKLAFDKNPCFFCLQFHEKVP